jgi:hypothetical protein
LVRRRAPVGVVALLIVGVALTVTVRDAPTVDAATISAAHRVGGCDADWTIDAPEFDAPAAVVIDAPTVAITEAAPLRAPASAAPRRHLLRLAPKTSPPGSLAPTAPRTRGSHEHGTRT